MFDVNLLAVLVSGIVAMILGGFWYSPLLFGNIWMKGMGFTEADMKEAKKKGMALAYFLNFLAALLTAYVLAHFIQIAGAENMPDALMTAGWIWLGFMVTLTLGSVLWDNKKWSVFFVNIAYQFVQVMAMAAILVSWT